MKTGIFVSHKGQRCGVYQYGTRVFNALRYGHEITWKYTECSSINDLAESIDRYSPDVIILNYMPITMPWVEAATLKSFGKVIFGMYHEVHQAAADNANFAFCDFLLCPDPTLIPRNPIIIPVPRISIDCEFENIAIPEVFTVGSFGFGTPGKGFDKLCALVNSEFDRACIRINIPPHDQETLCPQKDIDNIVARCGQTITKPGIDLIITHEFMSDAALLKFLAGNTINAFLYDDQEARGISSCVDYAIASNRPLAISKSCMFRHLHEFNPSICIEDRSLAAIAAHGSDQLAPLRSAYSPIRAGKSWEDAILAALDQRAVCGSVPDGRGFNKLLDDRSRHAYDTALNLLKTHAPAMLERKIERANIQQAFALDTTLRMLPKTGPARLLAIGSFEDTAVAALKAMGYKIDEVDPNVNGVDLQTFYRSTHSRIGGYAIIICVSVLEHVVDDFTFMRMTRDLLAPGGVAVFTVDFMKSYSEGSPKPFSDERLYTSFDIRARLMSAMPDCALLDVPTWDEDAEDFEYEGCHYGFAGWVFRKFDGELLKRASANTQYLWKQLLANAAIELPTDKTENFVPGIDVNTARSHAALCNSGDIYHRLIRDLKFKGGSRELQFGLKLARLLRKISLKLNPNRKRKLAEKKVAAIAAIQNAASGAGA